MSEKDPVIEAQIKIWREGRRYIGDDQVGCKLCNKSIEKIFVEHIEEHVEDFKKLKK